MTNIKLEFELNVIIEITHYHFTINAIGIISIIIILIIIILIIIIIILIILIIIIITPVEAWKQCKRNTSQSNV